MNQQNLVDMCTVRNEGQLMVPNIKRKSNLKPKIFSSKQNPVARLEISDINGPKYNKKVESSMRLYVNK